MRGNKKGEARKESGGKKKGQQRLRKTKSVVSFIEFGMFYLFFSVLTAKYVLVSRLLLL